MFTEKEKLHKSPEDAAHRNRQPYICHMGDQYAHPLAPRERENEIARTPRPHRGAIGAASAQGDFKIKAPRELERKGRSRR
jgi:hypothetical protein